MNCNVTTKSESGDINIINKAIDEIANSLQFQSINLFY